MDDVFAAAFAITHGSGGSLSGEVEGLPKGMQETENSAAAGSGTQPTAKNKDGPQPTVEPPRKKVKVAGPEVAGSATVGGQDVDVHIRRWAMCFTMAAVSDTRNWYRRR